MVLVGCLSKKNIFSFSHLLCLHIFWTIWNNSVSLTQQFLNHFAWYLGEKIANLFFVNLSLSSDCCNILLERKRSRKLLQISEYLHAFCEIRVKKKVLQRGWVGVRSKLFFFLMNSDLDKIHHEFRIVISNIATGERSEYIASFIFILSISLTFQKFPSNP